MAPDLLGKYAALSVSVLVHRLLEMWAALVYTVVSTIFELNIVIIILPLTIKCVSIFKL